MINWQTGKYATLMDLQNDAAKSCLRRSSTIITPRSSGSNSHHGKGKAPMTQPIVFGQINSDSHGNFGPSSSKGVLNTMRSWGHPKDAKADLKGSSNSTTFDKRSKRERSANNNNYES